MPEDIEVNPKTGWGLKSITPESATDLTTTQKLERKILEGAPSTPRNISMYSKGLGFESKEQLIELIEGKRVADAGSGFDGFALDAILQGIDTTIIPINPARENVGFVEDRRNAIEMWRDLYYSNYSSDAIDNALIKVDQNAVTAFAHDLSAIPNNEVDIVTDNLAVFHYSKPEFRDAYEQSIKEMLRILKPGGKILIGDGSNMIAGVEPWYREIFDKLGLDYQYIEREIPVGETTVTQRYGIEITKH